LRVDHAITREAFGLIIDDGLKLLDRAASIWLLSSVAGLSDPKMTLPLAMYGETLDLIISITAVNALNEVLHECGGWRGVRFEKKVTTIQNVGFHAR
jgi:hypothetical protein